MLQLVSQLSLLSNPHALLHGSGHFTDGLVSAARLSAIHFQGWSIRQVSYYTLLSGFRLP